MLKKIILVVILCTSFPLQASCTDKLALLESVTHIKPIQALIASYMGWLYQTKKIPVVHALHRLAYAPNGKDIAGLSFTDGSIRIWNAKTFQLLRVLHVGNVRTSIGYSADSHFLFAAHRLGIKKYIVDKKYDSHMHFLHPRTEGIILSAEGTIAHITDRELNFITPKKSGLTVDCLEPVRKKIICAAINPSGSQLAVSYADYTIQIYEKFAALIKRLPINLEDRQQSLAYSPNGKYLATGSQNRIMIWSDLKFLQPPRCLKAAWVTTLVFSPDSKYLAASTGNTIKIWDVQTLELCNILLEHTDPICSLIYAPDGSTLISGACDNSICIWKKYA